MTVADLLKQLSDLSPSLSVQVGVPRNGELVPARIACVVQCASQSLTGGDVCLIEVDELQE